MIGCGDMDAYSRKTRTPDKARPEPEDAPRDETEAAMQELIDHAKACGFVTYDMLNALLPADAEATQRFESMLAHLSEMGVRIVDEPESPGALSSRRSDDEHRSRVGEEDPVYRSGGRFSCDAGGRELCERGLSRSAHDSGS